MDRNTITTGTWHDYNPDTDAMDAAEGLPPVMSECPKHGPYRDDDGCGPCDAEFIHAMEHPWERGRIGGAGVVRGPRS